MKNSTQLRPDLLIRAATNEDLPQLQLIRQAAFAPVFASFRAILGDEIASITQANDDVEQAAYLASLFAPDSGWELYVAVVAGQGIGTALVQFALDRMKAAGMRVATVGTGGDPSHAPARRAYEKAGFSAQIPSVWMYRLL